MNIQVRFQDTRQLIHYLEEELEIPVERVISDTKVLAADGKVYSVRGDVQTIEHRHRYS